MRIRGQFLRVVKALWAYTFQPSRMSTGTGAPSSEAVQLGGTFNDICATEDRTQNLPKWRKIAILRRF